MRKPPAVKILISLPPTLRDFLEALKAEGYTASGYMAHLLREDRRARLESGWVPGLGWPHGSVYGPESPHYHDVKQMRAQRDARGQTRPARSRTK